MQSIRRVWSVDVGLRSLGVYVCDMKVEKKQTICEKFQHVMFKTCMVAEKEDIKDLRKEPLRNIWPLLEKQIKEIYLQSGSKWPEWLVIEQQVGEGNRNQMVQGWIQGYLYAVGCTNQTSVPARSKWAAPAVKQFHPTVPKKQNDRKKGIVQTMNALAMSDYRNMPGGFTGSMDNHCADAFGQLMRETAKQGRLCVYYNGHSFNW